METGRIEAGCDEKTEEAAWRVRYSPPVADSSEDFKNEDLNDGKQLSGRNGINWYVLSSNVEQSLGR